MKILMIRFSGNKRAGNGDTYYKIQYPEHNLVRTKAQLKLLQSVGSSHGGDEGICRGAGGVKCTMEACIL
jgi:hypothetical protein